MVLLEGPTPMFRRWLSRFRSGQPSRMARPRYRLGKLLFERLESREVLSGDVVAFFSGNNLQLIGDDDHNFVRMDLIDGDVVLRGENGTTVNGGASFIVRTDSAQLPGAVLASFGEGNDRIAFGAGITYAGGIHLTMGKGHDQISVDSSNLVGDLACITGKGDDVIALREVDIIGKLLLNTDRGDDTVSLDSVEISGDMLIDLGKGHDVLEVAETQVDGFTNILTAAGNDTVIFRSADLQSVFMSTGRGNDLVEYNQSTAAGQVRVHLDRGQDQMRFGSGTTIPSNLIVDGKRGQDAINTSSQSSGTIERVVQGFESNAVSADLFDARLNRPASGALARVSAAQGLFLGSPLASLTLSVGADSSRIVQSSNTLLTKQSAIGLNGTTLAGAKIELSRDADGLFDDGTAMADANGSFSVTANLVHTPANLGANVIRVRATDSIGRQVIEELNFHLAVGTVVRFVSGLGNMDFELLDTDAPNTVENFLNYQARYVDSIVHRSARSQTGGDFIIQGGGFKLNGNTVESITTDPPVQSEANPANSNIRGTLAMALPQGNPDGGTSQWFVNLAANTFLDAQDFTVFGRIIGDGLEVADAIHDLSTFNLAALVGQSALNETPLRNYSEFSVNLAGTVSLSAGSNLVTGVGTSFTTAIPADKRIRIGGQNFTVLDVVSDTQLQLVSNATQTSSNVTAQVNLTPIRPNYILFSSIGEMSLP